MLYDFTRDLSKETTVWMRELPKLPTAKHVRATETTHSLPSRCLMNADRSDYVSQLCAEFGQEFVRRPYECRRSRANAIARSDLPSSVAADCRLRVCLHSVRMLECQSWDESYRHCLRAAITACGATIGKSTVTFHVKTPSNNSCLMHFGDMRLTSDRASVQTTP